MLEQQQRLDKQDQFVDDILYREQRRDEHGIDRVARLVAKHVNDGPMKRNQVQSKIHGRDRHLFDAALTRAVELGHVAVVVQSDSSHQIQRGTNPVT